MDPYMVERSMEPKPDPEPPNDLSLGEFELLRQRTLVLGEEDESMEGTPETNETEEQPPEEATRASDSAPANEGVESVNAAGSSNGQHDGDVDAQGNSNSHSGEEGPKTSEPGDEGFDALKYQEMTWALFLVLKKAFKSTNL